jgi:TonB family protein
MKTILLFILLAMSGLPAQAQSTTAVDTFETDTTLFIPHKIPGDTTLFTAPMFVGGEKKLIRFVVTTLRYPAVAREKNEQGKVVTQMIIEKDGAVTNLQVTTHASDALDKEALRTLSLMPKWIPGSYNHHPVRTLWSIPLTFTLQTDK